VWKLLLDPQIRRECSTVGRVGLVRHRLVILVDLNELEWVDNNIYISLKLCNNRATKKRLLSEHSPKEDSV